MHRFTIPATLCPRPEESGGFRISADQRHNVISNVLTGMRRVFKGIKGGRGRGGGGEGRGRFRVVDLPIRGILVIVAPGSTETDLVHTEPKTSDRRASEPKRLRQSLSVTRAPYELIFCSASSPKLGSHRSKESATVKATQHPIPCQSKHLSLHYLGK